MTDVNIPLLRKAVEWAEGEAARPEIDRQWQQDSWLTEPKSKAYILIEDGCLANTWTEEERIVSALAPHCGTAYCIAGWVGQTLDARYANSSEVDGVHVSHFAADALGIPRDSVLFGGGNSIADVRRIAEDYAGERL